MDRLAQFRHISRRVVDEKFAKAFARQQPLCRQRLEQEVTVAAPLRGLGRRRAFIGVDPEAPAPFDVMPEPEALERCQIRSEERRVGKEGTYQASTAEGD